MIRLTKIFHFELAHAIYGYNGPCKNIHGHSYELHVSIAAVQDMENYLAPPGFVMDFKDLKKIVKNNIIDHFDHKLILSSDFLLANPSFASQENLLVWEVEPTAENLLIYIRNIISKRLPVEIKLQQLKLYETKNSYAEWINGFTFNQY
jgi:6-pyruvoyltetrahydropterin/6-carboxytetrahydropterin synthase